MKHLISTAPNGRSPRAAGGKNCQFNLDLCKNLFGLIWTSVICPGSTNHRRPVLNLALKKNKINRGWQGVQERKIEIKEKKNKKSYFRYTSISHATNEWTV